MPHPRQVIRTAIVNALASANTMAASRVHPMRVEAIRPASIRATQPGAYQTALAVYTLQEDSEEIGSAPVELRRELSVEIAGFAYESGASADAAAATLANKLDELALQVENTVDKDRTLGGLVQSITLDSTTIDISNEGDPLVGVVTLKYVALYRTDHPTLLAIPPVDFDRAGVQTQIDGAEDAVADLVEVST